MSSRGRRISQIIGGCITLAALASSAYFATAARDTSLRISREAAAVLFRLPVDVSKEGQYEAAFRTENAMAHGVRLVIEAEGNSPSPVEAAETVNELTGKLGLRDGSGRNLWEGNFSPAEPMMPSFPDGAARTNLLGFHPGAGTHRFFLHITGPAPADRPRVVFTGRYFHCGLERLMVRLLIGFLAGSLLVAAIAGTLTGRSVWRSRR